MKKNQKILIASAIAMSCSIFSASAQIYVSIRPARPVYVRTAAPGPAYIWVDEEWQERGGNYEWRGGHWVKPPHDGDRYQEGHWGHSSRGHSWNEGHWDHSSHEHGRKEGNEHHENRRRQ